MEKEMKSTREKTSYCIGFETGRNLKNQFVDMDTDLLVAGFQDALFGRNSQLTQEEMQSVLNTLKQQIELQQKQFIAKIAEENKRVGERFLAENKNKPGVTTLPSGLQYQIITSGTGKKPTPFDVVSMHFKCFHLNGTALENSYERGKPVVFPVNQAIPGWSEALQLMHVGDKWRIFCPSYLAYGEAGFGNEIPPNLSLIFELELLGINEPN